MTKLEKLSIPVRSDSLNQVRITRINSFSKKVSNSKNDEKIGWEMMGAGNDPLKKNQDFAKLANHPK